MSNKKRTFTVTYGDVAENHAGMQKIGELAENGYSIEKMGEVKDKLDGLGLTTEMVDLNENCGFEIPAKVLVIRKGAQFVLGEETTEGLIAENDALTMDKTAKMRGKVVNKRARYNLCFGEEDQNPDIENGKGTIVSWDRVPKLSKIREFIAEMTGDELSQVRGEGNYYYDIEKCGIGFHGDSERKKVFAVRMGEKMPLYFKWFQRSLPIGNPMKVDLNDGDMYMMSEKAVGFDWKKKKIQTLRHSTGCKKFTGVDNDFV
jgi:hypothetical protein